MRGRCRRRLLALLALLMLLPAFAASAAERRLTSVGSDTLGELLQAWAQAYADGDSTLRFQIRTPGSAAAPAALATGAADLGPMSRAMTAEEAADYQRRRGREPGRVRIAYDAVALFVHPDNPLRALRPVSYTHLDVYKRQLLDQVWGGSVYVEERTVDVHIRRLRKTLEPYKVENLVQTVRGAGYRFSVTP